MMGMLGNKDELDKALNPKIDTDLDIEFEELKTSESIKTIYLLVNRNFQKLRTFLLNLVKHVEDISSNIDLDNIVNDVIEEINVNKQNIIIKPDIGANQSVIIDGYIVTRSDKDIYKIVKQKGEWKTDNLMVQVKEESTGTILYPTITTIDDYIEIYFVNGLYTNVKVLML